MPAEEKNEKRLKLILEHVNWIRLMFTEETLTRKFPG